MGVSSWLTGAQRFLFFAVFNQCSTFSDACCLKEVPDHCCRKNAVAIFQKAGHSEAHSTDRSYPLELIFLAQASL
jgi:hypothetical protein